MWREHLKLHHALTACGLTAGEASVSVTLKFVPTQLLESPQFRGLHIDLVVRSVNISTLEPVGPPLTYAPLGSTLHFLLQVTSLDAVGQTTVRALMPGGVEPIDGNLDVDGAHFIVQLCWITRLCASISLAGVCRV
jgi:hypothetical protein